MARPDVAVQRTYLTLTLFTTLAASFIWGINTLFLLDAGLDNTQAFAANAFFTVGQVLFEVPTGVIADTRGRRFSFLLGTSTLLVATLLYLVMWELRAGFLGWAISSILLGLGFTFFSGATEAWLVDALKATDYKGTLESIFARAQVVTGVAMLTGLGRGRVRRPGRGPRGAVRAASGAARRDVPDRVPLHARHRVHARPWGERRRRGRRRAPGVGRRRPAQPAGALADAVGAVHGRRRASSPSTRSSRTCSSSTAIRPPTGWRASPRRSSPAPRSPAG